MIRDPLFARPASRTAAMPKPSRKLAFIVAERLKREREGRPEPEFSIAAGE